jgi:outer membrane protein OmpA-like peptidoglycan-associated protein
MKKLLLLLLAFAMVNCVSAQVLNRLGNRAKNTVERKTGDKIDRAISDAMDGKTKKGNTDTDSGTEEKASDDKEPAKPAKTGGLKAYSKFDFVPGDMILYAEDFSQDVIGEFPVKWNTNGSGEIVTIEGVPGKWLQLNERTKYDSPYDKKFPDNYTIEFDLLADYKDGQAVPAIFFKFYKDIKYNHTAGAWLKLSPQAGTYADDNTRDRVSLDIYDSLGKHFLEASDQLHGEFQALNKKNTPVHVAIWVQKTRVRVWLNSRKVYDLPKALPEGIGLNSLGLELYAYGGARDNYQYYFSNLKLAAATPDNRSKLITEGKWSTTGILFDVASDKIKPSSYGTLKQIAGVLNENPDVKVKIVGHTDNDGSDDTNLSLSKKRSAAVKAALVSEFGIDEGRMQTDGQGESKPVGDNKSPEGKAQNRRVEFIKL